MIRNIIALAACASASISLANNFSSADILFESRDGSFNASTKARAAYEQISTDGLSKADQVYRVVQMARLDMYRGGMLSDADYQKEGHSVKERLDVFRSCLDTVETIKDTGAPEYHFLKVSCMAWLGKFASFAERVRRAYEMDEAKGPALDSSKENGRLVGGFEGGGTLRIVSALNTNSKTKPLPGVDLYNPVNGLYLSQIALDTAAASYRPYPEELSGQDYPENYYYKAYARLALAVELESESTSWVSRKKFTKEVQERAEALKYVLGEDPSSWVSSPKSLANTAVSELADLLEDFASAEDYPKGRVSESAYYMEQAKSLKAKVEDCFSKEKWHKCIGDVL